MSPSNDAVERTAGPLRYSYPWSAIETSNEVFDNGDFHFKLANFLSHPTAIDPDFPRPLSADSQHTVAQLTSILRGIHRTADVPRITKRVRDHIGSPPGKDLWRRSSLWLLIRVAIQMSLDCSPLGMPSYKQFILFLICTLARDANDAGFSSDLLHLMSCKVLRRLKKLGSSTPDWLSEMALKTCTCLRGTLDTRFRQPDDRSSPFQNPSQDELTRDTQLSLLDGRGYIHHALRVANPGYKPVHRLRFQLSHRLRFHPSHRLRGTIEDFLSSDGAFLEGAYRADPEVTLYDVEQSVEQGIDDWLACVVDVDGACAQLEILMDQYIMKAASTWTRNPETISITFLTAIELFVALDKLVVKKVPMLADYSPEIPIIFLESLLLRKTTSLHRLSCAYQYLSARQFRSRPGWSVLSDEFTEDSFPVRFYNQSPHLQDLRTHIEEDTIQEASEHVGLQQEGGGVSQSPLPLSLMHAKVVVFELQCPACLRIWRSAIARILIAFSPHENHLDEEREHNLLAHAPGLHRYFNEHKGPNVSVKIQFAYFFHPKHPQSHSRPTLYYVVRQHSFRYWPILRWRSAGIFWPALMQDHGLPGTRYVTYTSHTSNDVLAAQADCPPDLSLDEFIAFGHLRNGGSLQWLNILHGLRSRTLNLRRNEVHYLLAYAAFQVGPLDLNTGTWTWHQELQDTSFCNALLQELNSLFMDVGAGSIDDVLMNTISLLLTRVLASTPSEGVSERAITLLRNVRRKTFKWVEELSYNLTMAPTNEERSKLLFVMAATCRSTFDIDTTALRKLSYTAEDVDALLSCALFVEALRPECMSNS